MQRGYVVWTVAKSNMAARHEEQQQAEIKECQEYGKALG